MDTDKTVAAIFELQAAQAADKQVWSKSEISRQIRRIDAEIGVALKQHAEDHNVENGATIDGARNDLHLANVNYSNERFNEAEKNLSDSKDKLTKVVNKIGQSWVIRYYASLWGFTPIACGITGTLVFLALLYWEGTGMILSSVPVWALWIAGLGASIQILVGIAGDYKEDCQITEYKRTWYFVIIFVSLGFGLLAFLLVQAGLVSLSQGTLTITSNNVAMSSTATPLPTIIVSPSITPAPSVSPAPVQITQATLALPFVVCFLAGYATEWFMGMIRKLTS